MQLASFDERAALRGLPEQCFWWRTGARRERGAEV